MKFRRENYEGLAEKLMVKPSNLMLDILEMIADPEDAELLLTMPGTPVQLSQRVDKPAHEVEAQCRRLYQKGLALKTLKEGKLGYRMHKDITMFRDATVHWPDAPKAYKDLWKRFMDEEWSYYARLEAKLVPLQRGRVIPIERSILSGKQQKILDSESVTRIIEKAETLTITECICRVIERKCDMPQETCLQVNNSAKYMLDRGIGREVSRQEALDILKRCEEAGLVHMTLNRSAVDHFICNCCPCCCVSLPMVIKEGLGLCEPSRYQADIDPEVCTLCETCLDRCYFGAIEKVETDGRVIALRVKGDKCMGCGLCHSSCPVEAISLVAVREAAFIPSS